MRAAARYCRYTVWGSGAEHPPQLFNLTADPDEATSVHARDARHAALADELDALLRRSIDYPNVSMAVAKCVPRCCAKVRRVRCLRV